FIPVRINYTVGGKKFEKKLDVEDHNRLKRIADLPLPNAVPTIRFPVEEMYHGSRLAPKGIDRIHHLYFPRAAQAMGTLSAKTIAIQDQGLPNMMIFFIEQAIWGLSMLNRYGPLHFSQVNRYLSGVYYVASQVSECSPWYILNGKLKRLIAT